MATTTNADPQRYLNVADAAAYIGVSPTTLRRLIDADAVKCIAARRRAASYLIGSNLTHTSRRLLPKMKEKARAGRSNTARASR